ncbi:MAG: LysR family transcriptional regulator [Myxococcota bacterium]
MEKWSEIRSASYVVRLGTVSAAAEALGVHRSTVIRHIDALEDELGQRLFQRHSRGYTPTELGRDLLKVAQAADAHFKSFVGRSRAQDGELTGELVVTSTELSSPMVLPRLLDFRRRHPSVVVRYLVSPRIYRLEYGEAHVAIRVGTRPEGDDDVVRSFDRIEFKLYASRSYAEQFGVPDRRQAFSAHRFVRVELDGDDTPFHRWLDKAVPDANFVFRSSHPSAVEEAIAAGAGIGFLPVHYAERRDDLVAVHPVHRAWIVPCWVVTHVDLHRSPKVQALLRLFAPSE